MNMIKREGNIQTFLVVISLIKANADTVLVRLPQLQHRLLQVTIDTDNFVQSLSECAAVCDLRHCDVISYHETTSQCTTAYNQKPNVSVVTILSGIVYRKKEIKSCQYDGYVYAWELDMCVRFYYLNKDRATWQNSREKCQSEAGDLIAVDSAETEILFLPYLNDKHESTGVIRWWIGASDENDDGNFRWVGGSSMTHTNWDLGQPDNLTGAGDSINIDCVQYFYRSVEKAFGWFDTRCDTKMAFICESKTFVTA